MVQFFEKDLILDTERLLLRPINSSDREFIKRLYNPSNIGFLGSRVKTAEYREKYIELSLYLRERKTRLDLILIDRYTGARIGMKQLNFFCLVKPLGPGKGFVVQYDGFVYTTSIVLPEWRGKGYMTEATAAIMNCLFANQVRAIMCDIDSRNIASISYSKKLGFAKVPDNELNELDRLTSTGGRGDSLEETYAYVYGPNYEGITGAELNHIVKSYPTGPPPISL